MKTAIQTNCRGIQSILATPKGFRVTTPKAPIETEKAALKLLSLHCTRELIELEIQDMTRAIYYAEAGL